jgi:hypothetical protein
MQKRHSVGQVRDSANEWSRMMRDIGDEEIEEWGEEQEEDVMMEGHERRSLVPQLSYCRIDENCLVQRTRGEVSVFPAKWAVRH